MTSRSMQDTDLEKVMVRVALFPALSVTFTFMVCSPFRPSWAVGVRVKILKTAGYDTIALYSISGSYI